MNIGPERQPAIRLEDGRLIPLLSARVERDAESSYLCSLVAEDGLPLRLEPDCRVALVSRNAIVLFEGIVQPDGSVLDLLSCQQPTEGYEDL